MPTHRVGGEVDALCTRCKLLLGHTIVAMVGTKIARVRCNTCHGDHAFRGAPSSSSTSSAARKTPRSEAGPKVVLGFAAQIAAKNPATAKRYNARQVFSADDLIEHPTFGLGIVTAVRSDKIDVAFKADTKTLIHARGESPAEKPHFSPPPSPSSEPTDKPL